MLLNDSQIKTYQDQYGIFDLFSDNQVREFDGKKIISYGLSSFGYDIRLAPEFKLLKPGIETIDPKKDQSDEWTTVEGTEIVLAPNSFLLGRSMEYVRMPKKLLGICTGKSTYARCGIFIGVTPLEPGWEGHITLEFANTTSRPVKLYAGEGCVQINFYEGKKPLVTYATRGGKYMGQQGITLAKV